MHSAGNSAMTGMKSLTNRVPKNVSRYVDCRGTARWRYRRNGFTAELGKEFGTPEFYKRLSNAECVEKDNRYPDKRTKAKGTMSWLIAQYKADRRWKGLKASTKRAYNTSLTPLEENHGNRRVADLRAKHIEKIVSDMFETPAAANNMLKRLNTLMKLAIRLEQIEHNPTEVVERYKIAGGGIKTWTDHDIEKFEATHPDGTLANKVMTLMLSTGMARSDIVKLGWGNIQHGRIVYTRQKTETTGGEPINIPIHPDILPILKETPKQQTTFLETALRKKRSADKLGHLMRQWCDEAGLPDCSSHGLRKGICRKLAEAGATAMQIKAVTGHKKLSSVDIYVQEANRKIQSDDAFRALLDRSRHIDKNTPIDEL